MEVNKLSYGGTPNTSFKLFEVNHFLSAGSANSLRQDRSNVVTGTRSNGLDSNFNRIGSFEGVKCNADIAEIIAFNKNLSSDERTQIENYILEKYGI